MTEVGGSSRQQDSTLFSLISATGKQSLLTAPSSLEDPSSASHAYLLSLTSQSLLDLRSQPAALSTAQASLNTQLSSLCSQHVPSFVQVHRATCSLPSAFNSLESVLQSLIESDLPALSDAAQHFTHQVESPLLAKEKAQNLISQYELSLKDLMDIPRLLMTCVRANHPVEALLLAAHMTKVGSQSKHSSVVDSLQQECWLHLKRLREDLLRGLGARGLRLPAARRYLSLLRKFKEVDEAKTATANGSLEDGRLEKLSLSDSTICLSFLRSRWALIDGLTSSESEGKTSSLLSSRLSTWRDLVGDSSGMAQALFSDSTQNVGDELAPTTLISCFAHQAMATMRRLLIDGIPRLQEDHSSLADEFETLAAIHTQLAYSAASLSRQGIDFSRAVSGDDVLHQQVITLWRKGMNTARLGYEKSRKEKAAVEGLSWVGGANVSDLLSQGLQSYSSMQDWSIRVRQFPDLLVLTNELLRAYNALLSFAPATFGLAILKELDATLLAILQPLLQAVKTDEREEYSLSLPSILSANSQSSYFAKDAKRQSQANSAVLARVLSCFCGPIMTHTRGLLMGLFDIEANVDEGLDGALKEAEDWAETAEETWHREEKTRREEVKEEEERIAEEEKKIVEEEEARLAEMERRKAEEAARRQEEEAEKQRLAEEKRAQEAAVEKERAEQEAEKRRKEEEKRREEERKQQRVAEEEAQRQKEADEEAQRRKEAEEEAQRLKEAEAEEEARRLKEAEEEKQRLTEAEGTQRKLKAEAEEAQKKKKAQEAEEARRHEEAETLKQGEKAEKETMQEKENDMRGTEEDQQGEKRGTDAQDTMGESGKRASEGSVALQESPADEDATIRQAKSGQVVDAEGEVREENKASTAADEEDAKSPDADRADDGNTHATTGSTGEEGEKGEATRAGEREQEQKDASDPRSSKANKLAEKLRLRQEARERAAKAG